mgnify:CR=1 FL=1
MTLSGLTLLGVTGHFISYTFIVLIIRDVVGVTLLRLDERYADYHQVAFLAFARSDGNLLNAGTNPVKHLALTT